MPPPEVPYCPSPSLETNIPESNSSMSMREFTDKNNTQNAFSNDISGEWNGYIEIQREPYRTHLFVQQTGMNLSGKVIYQNVEESLEGAIKTNGQIFLKGVSYRRLSGTGGFNLDTFQGRLSEDGLSIAGNSVDTSGFNASWSLTKGPGRLSDVDSRNKAETNKEVSIINTVGKWAETQKSLPDAVNPKMDSKQTGKTIPTTFSERNSRSGYSRPSVSEGTNTGRKHISSEKHYNNIKRNSIRKSRRD